MQVNNYSNMDVTIELSLNEIAKLLKGNAVSDHSGETMVVINPLELPNSGDTKFDIKVMKALTTELEGER